MIWGILALVTAAMFTGAAFYINFAEQPARMRLDDAGALAEWQPSYQRGLQMQVALLAVSIAAALVAAFYHGDWRWLVGAALFALNLPFTFAFIMPTNRRLQSTPPEKADSMTRGSLQQWGRLHAVRTLLGFAAIIAYAWAMLR